MSLGLRLVLIVASLITLIFISRKIRSSKVKLEDSIFWICFAVLIFLLSLFPEAFYFFSDVIGFQAPANFVFLFFYFCIASSKLPYEYTNFSSRHEDKGANSAIGN